MSEETLDPPLPPTKRNPRAPTDPITGSGCASNTVS